MKLYLVWWEALNTSRKEALRLRESKLWKQAEYGYAVILKGDGATRSEPT